jgi:hypothetical protein
VAATDDPAIALKTVRYLLRERKGVTVDDVLLWHFNPPIEFAFTEQHVDDILSNKCRICGSKFNDPCDAGLHS